jgi:2-oxoglutarate/2-oxoacid ferredoxin oxidoreductase subunit beta
VTSTATAPEGTTKVVFERPHIFVEEGTPWCQGCGYGAWSRIIIEEIERANPAKLVAACDIACLEYMHEIIPGDITIGLHGRSVATVRGMKMAQPDAMAIAFQGDGGMLNEGLNEVIHAAASGQNIIAILGNNGVFGDTGGQHTLGAPMGLKTPTSPNGREAKTHGTSIPLAEMLAMMPGTAFVGRISTHDPAYVFRGAKILRKAIEASMAGAGFVFLECLTTCPTGWRMTPVEAVKYHEEVMLKERPVGILKDWDPATHPAVEPALPKLS